MATLHCVAPFRIPHFSSSLFLHFSSRFCIFPSPAAFLIFPLASHRIFSASHCESSHLIASHLSFSLARAREIHTRITRLTSRLRASHLRVSSPCSRRWRDSSPQFTVASSSSSRLSTRDRAARHFRPLTRAHRDSSAPLRTRAQLPSPCPSLAVHTSSIRVSSRTLHFCSSSAKRSRDERDNRAKRWRRQNATHGRPGPTRLIARVTALLDNTRATPATHACVLQLHSRHARQTHVDSR